MNRDGEFSEHGERDLMKFVRSKSKNRDLQDFVSEGELDFKDGYAIVTATG